jgi:cytoskeletal protein CcmA (bactofilin family)
MPSKIKNDEANNTTSLATSSYDQALPILADKISQNQSIMESSIGKAVFIKGNVSAKEDMLVNGRLEGTISLKNNKLEIGPSGSIVADAIAKVIVINGEIKGDVYASDKVVVTKTGRVIGNIFATNISVEDGAILKGSVDMDGHDASKNNSVFDLHDDHEKTSFGSLFKKVRGIAHLDSPIHNDVYTTQPQESTALVVNNNKTNHDYPFTDISVIGESVMVKGEIIAEEDVVLQGQVDGTIYFKNNSLVAGHQAQIHGNLFVKSIVTHGEIKGDIYASDQVIVKKLGHIFGNTHAPRISIESGAILMGNIEMEPQDIEKAFSNVVGYSVTKEKANAVLEKSSEKIADAML